jgi:hypothetical protein
MRRALAGGSLLVCQAVLVVLLAGCREEQTKEDAGPPPLAPECSAYVASAEACVAAAGEKAKPAVQAVFSANQADITKANNVDKMKKLADQCKKWSELLAQNPACKGP